MKTKIEYFSTLYTQNDDPWGYEHRWYEERKRNICLSVLLKPMYEHVLEIGCSNGVFSQHLALRSTHLLCLDGHEAAVDLARARLSSFRNVDVLQALVPDEFPLQKFDLIVIGEVLYYLNVDELMQLIEKLRNALTDDGMILCCHWRYPIEHFSLNGDMVHQVFKDNILLYHYLSLKDPDFMIDLWTKDTQSVANREGLV